MQTIRQQCWTNSAENWLYCGAQCCAEADWPRGAVARRMMAAVMPYASEYFITPMAAVAGAVAEEILASMLAFANVSRAYVNDGGDIALHLTPGETLRCGDGGSARSPVTVRNDVLELVRSSAGHRDQRMAWTQLFFRHRGCGNRVGWTARQQPTPQPRSSRTPSTCRGIPRSCAPRPGILLRTATWVSGW